MPDPNDVNNPAFPIGCVHQEQNADGTSPNTPPLSGGVVPITIGTDTLCLVKPIHLLLVTLRPTLLQVVMLLTLSMPFRSAPGETFTGGQVTWASDGATTVTATATSATATDSGATGTLPVTVAAAPVVHS